MSWEKIKIILKEISSFLSSVLVQDSLRCRVEAIPLLKANKLALAKSLLHHNKPPGLSPVGLPLFCLVSTVYFVSQRLCPSCAKSVFVHYMTLAGTVVMHRLLFWGLCRVKEFTEVCSPMYRPPVIREQMVEACSSPEWGFVWDACVITLSLRLKGSFRWLL